MDFASGATLFRGNLETLKKQEQGQLCPCIEETESGPKPAEILGLEPLKEDHLAQVLQTHGEELYAELWVSLASLLRSYTAAHGLNGNRQATVELGEQKITVRHAEKWLALDRQGQKVAWTRENGSGGILQLTEHGRLRAASPQGAATQEEELDMAAEAWARDLMQEPQQ